VKFVWGLLTAAAVAACGADSEPKDPQAALKKMFSEYSDAVAGADWKKTCERTAPEYVSARYSELLQEGVGKPPQDCVALMEFAVRRQPGLEEKLKDEYDDAHFETATPEGKTATVDFIMTTGDDRLRVTMYARRDDDGRWKVTSITT
jgi:hypothetical protein